MKLPNNQMQAPKLQKIRPLKRSLARLSRSKLFKALRSQPTQKSTTDPKTDSKESVLSEKATTGKANGNSLMTSIKTAKQSKSVRIALNLLLVRPWVLLVGFWLISLVGGTLALDGMLSPRKLRMALPEAPVVETPLATSQIQITPDSDGASAELDSESEVDSQPEVISIGADTNADSSAGIPLLPAVILVGGCATGCLVMSRRRAMARMAAARARSRGRVRKVSSSAKASPARVGQPLNKPAMSIIQKGNTSANTTKGNPRKPVRAATSTNGAGITATPSTKKRRQRVRKPVVAQSPNRSQRPLASRATAQTTASQSQAAQPRTSRARASKQQVRRASSRIASRRQPMVSVVPANESHALDWNNNSLAHQMDIRAQRSAM